MNITFSYSRGIGSCYDCVAPEKVPGTQVDIDNEVKTGDGGDSRFVKAVPCEHPLLVDKCKGYPILKVADPECLFFVPSNEEELKAVSPLIAGLMQRKIIVLKTTHRSDMEAMKKNCRESFYNSEGALINSRFEGDNMSPEKMAEIGFEFIGDSNNDIVACCYKRSHVLYRWEHSDDPRSMHNRNYGALCIVQEGNRIPVLSTKTGKDVTGEMFHLILSKNSLKTGRDECCQRTSLVTHVDYPLQRASFQSIAWAIDSVKLDQTKAVLESRLLSRRIDRKYSELHQQGIRLQHFSGMLRQFQQLSQDYIELLTNYKSLLDLDNSADINSSVSVLSSGSVEQEIDRTVGYLSTNDMAKTFSRLLGVLPDNVRVSGTEAITGNALKNIEKHAAGYSGRFFVDDALNNIVLTGQLGTVFSEDYFTSDKRDENLTGLLEKGTDITGVLVHISEKIHELLSPFLDEKD